MCVCVLEAADYNEIDQVFPFFGEIIDSHCGNSTSASLTEVCTAYVDLVNRIYRRFQSPGWRNVGLLDLQRHINSFT